MEIVEELGHTHTLDKSHLAPVADHFYAEAARIGYEVGVPNEYRMLPYKHQLPSPQRGLSAVDAAEAMRTIGSCRRYKPDHVPDEVVYRAVEAARFAPQGGNRQPTRLVVVRDRALKERLRDLYLVPWRAYYKAASAGSQALGEHDSAQKAADAANRFAENLAEVPLIIVVCARIDALQVTDRDQGRPSVVGGASIYPFVQNLCIALRVEGVATTITTLLCEYESEVKELLGIPDEYLTACHVAAGYPEGGFPTKLRRMAVEEIAFVDRFGESIGGP